MHKRNYKRTDYLLIVLGTLSFVYFIILLMNMSFTSFLLIYPLFTLLCYIYAGIELKCNRSLIYMFPSILRYLIIALMLLFFSSFIAAEGIIVFQSMNSHEAKTDYVLVLGAQVIDDKISASLQYRLDAAMDIYKRYPDSIFIVSGGKGPDENNSEAYYMEKHLLEQGVPQEQVIKEEQSTNTYENVFYSKRIMDNYSDDNYDVTIVTNAFHTYRSKFLAEQVDMKAYTYSADMHKVSIPHFYIREYFGLMKDLFLNFRK